MRILTAVIVASIIVLGPASAGIVAAPSQAQAQAQDTPAIRELKAAFAAAYNLNHDEALGRARNAVRLDPASARVHRGLASIIWIQLLFRRGATTVDHYLGGLSTNQINLPKPPADLAEEFKGAIGKSIELAEKRLRQNSRDIDAMFDVGAAYGVQASYVASVEGSITTAFKSARRAFEMMSLVLARDPSRTSAGMIVGTYRYVISSQPGYVRLFAWLAGFSGDKDKAIAIVEAASHDPLSRIDAKTALVLIYSREGRHNEAVRLTRELQQEAPKNRMFVLEEGSASIRAGHADQAEAALTRGLIEFSTDQRPKIPGEQALWLYKRGLARLNQNHPADAAADLRLALNVGPVRWVEGRIHVALGKLADLAGKRPEAIDEYTKARTICDAAPDAACSAEARSLLKQPFSFTR